MKCVFCDRTFLGKYCKKMKTQLVFKKYQKRELFFPTKEQHQEQE